MTEWKLVHYILVFAVIAAVGTMAFLALNPGKSARGALNPQAAFAAENPQNPCATPAGYTDATWREHMGHHPEQYQQCLNP